MTSTRVGKDDPRRGLKVAGLVLVLVLLVTAALIAAWRGGRESQPNTPESAMPYVCLRCSHNFKLTPADFERLSRDKGVKGPKDPTVGGIVLFRCPKCSELAGAQAVACPKDGTLLPRRLENGRPGHCPKCNWSFYLR